MAITIVKTKPQKLSAESEHLIDCFDESARDWGWQCDQGSKKSVIEQSEKDYHDTMEDLKGHVLRLEQEIWELKEKK